MNILVLQVLSMGGILALAIKKKGLTLGQDH
jgi:hypothetical protein